MKSRIVVSYKDEPDKVIYPQEITLNWRRYLRGSKGRPVKIVFYNYVPKEKNWYVLASEAMHPSLGQGVFSLIDHLTGSSP